MHIFIKYVNKKEYTPLFEHKLKLTQKMVESYISILFTFALLQGEPPPHPPPPVKPAPPHHTPAAAPGVWTITPTDRMRYDQIFNSLGPEANKLHGNKVSCFVGMGKGKEKGKGKGKCRGRQM